MNESIESIECSEESKLIKPQINPRESMIHSLLEDICNDFENIDVETDLQSKTTIETSSNFQRPTNDHDTNVSFANSNILQKYNMKTILETPLNTIKKVSPVSSDQINNVLEIHSPHSDILTQNSETENVIASKKASIRCNTDSKISIINNSLPINFHDGNQDENLIFAIASNHDLSEAYGECIRTDSPVIPNSCNIPKSSENFSIKVPLSSERDVTEKLSENKNLHTKLDDADEQHVQVIEETECEIKTIQNQSEIFPKNRSTAKKKVSKKKFIKVKTLENRKMAKARRISAKMKKEWAEELEISSHIACPMPGCYQTYVTVANFQTHYKWCTGKKNLQHCPYCESLIFSGHAAVLHHMEVEHPEKVNEHIKREKLPAKEGKKQDENNYSKNQGISHTHTDASVVKGLAKKYRRFKHIRKGKFSSKENILNLKRPCLKKKLKSIEKQNIKDFTKCVKFNDIVQKIHAVTEREKVALSKDEEFKYLKTKPLKFKKRALMLTDGIVEEKTNYFNVLEAESVHDLNENEIELKVPPKRVSTKSKNVLNTQGYKRFNEYLKLTRDWASERKTYSRNRNSDSSFDSPLKKKKCSAENIQDTHQLNDVLSLIGGSSSDDVNRCEDQQSVSCLSTDQDITPLPQNYAKARSKTNTHTHTPTSEKPALISVKANPLSLSMDLSVEYDKAKISGHSGRERDEISQNYGHMIFSKANKFCNKERVTCYDNACNLTAPGKKKLRSKSSIFFDGEIITDQNNCEKNDLKKKDSPLLTVPDFDSLINSSVSLLSTPVGETKKKRGRPAKNVQSTKRSGDDFKCKSFALHESSKRSKSSKQDGVKLPLDSSNEPAVKKKRGRPRKTPLLESALISHDSIKRMTNCKKKSIKCEVSSTNVASTSKQMQKSKFSRLAKKKDSFEKQADLSIDKTGKVDHSSENSNIQTKHSDDNLTTAHIQEISMSDAKERESNISSDACLNDSNAIKQIDYPEKQIWPTFDDSKCKELNDAIFGLDSELAFDNIDLDTITNEERNFIKSTHGMNPKLCVSYLRWGERFGKPPQKETGKKNDPSPASRKTSKITENEDSRANADLTKSSEMLTTISKNNLSDNCIVTPGTPVECNSDLTIASTPALPLHTQIRKKIPSKNMPNKKKVLPLITQESYLKSDDLIGRETAVKDTVEHILNTTVNSDYFYTDLEKDALVLRTVRHGSNLPNTSTPDTRTRKSRRCKKMLKTKKVLPLIAPDCLVNVKNQEKNDVTTDMSSLETEETTIVKRKRGRPKKNLVSKISIIDNAVLQLANPSENIFPNKMNYSSLEAKCQSIAEDSSSNAIEKKPVSSLRKSSRLRKCKNQNSESFHPLKKNVELQCTSTNRVGTLIKKTGKRGRPRKHAVKNTEGFLHKENFISHPYVQHDELSQDSTTLNSHLDGTTSDNLIRTSSLSKYGHATVNRKCSRKGSPRKCLRYADLNSGIDSSESLDEISHSHSKDLFSNNVTSDEICANSLPNADANLIQTTNENLLTDKNQQITKYSKIYPKTVKSEENTPTGILPALPSGINHSQKLKTLHLKKSKGTSLTKTRLRTKKTIKFSKNKKFKGTHKDETQKTKHKELVDLPNQNCVSNFEDDVLSLAKMGLPRQMAKTTLSEDCNSSQKVIDKTSLMNPKQLDSSESPGPHKRRGKKTRKAALKARKMLVNLVHSNKDLCDGETPDDENDCDFSAPIDEIENGELSDLHEVKDHGQSAEEELAKYKEYYFVPNVAKRNVSSSLQKKWIKELETNGRIRCRQEGCGKFLESKLGMIYHYENACQKRLKKWLCKLCDKSLKPSPRVMLRHMRINHFKKNSSVSSPVSLYASKSLQSKSNYNRIDQTLNFYYKHTYENLMPEWKPRKIMWKRIGCSDYKSYLPPLETSGMMSIEHISEKKVSQWFNLNCFQSCSTNADSSATFFAGGPICSSAWCPTPYWAKATQFLALATSSIMEPSHNPFSTEEAKGLLQFWDVGLLQDAVMDSTPTLRLAIAHQHGHIWDMAWCPSGCWEDPSKGVDDPNELLPRLGLLAVACADSYIRIYSIPQPECLNCTSTDFPIFCSWPAAILRPTNGGPSAITQKAMCTSLSWQRTDKCELIVGGYSNGLINIWQVTNATQMLTKEVGVQKTILPYLTFQAHSSPVTSLSYAPYPGGRWIASSSFDKSLKVWDLMDICIPFFEGKKGNAKCLQWSMHWCGIFLAMDEGTCAKGSTSYQDCSLFNCNPRCLSSNNSCALSSSVSEWLDMEVVGDYAGRVTATPLRQINVDHVKLTAEKNIPVFWTELRQIQHNTSPNFSNSLERNVTNSTVSKKSNLLSSEESLCKVSYHNSAIEPSLDKKQYMEGHVNKKLQTEICNSSVCNSVSGNSKAKECHKLESQSAIDMLVEEIISSVELNLASTADKNLHSEKDPLSTEISNRICDSFEMKEISETLFDIVSTVDKLFELGVNKDQSTSKFVVEDLPDLSINEKNMSIYKEISETLFDIISTVDKLFELDINKDQSTSKFVAEDLSDLSVNEKNMSIYKTDKQLATSLNHSQPVHFGSDSLNYNENIYTEDALSSSNELEIVKYTQIKPFKDNAQKTNLILTPDPEMKDNFHAFKTNAMETSNFIEIFDASIKPFYPKSKFQALNQISVPKNSYISCDNLSNTKCCVKPQKTSNSVLYPVKIDVTDKQNILDITNNDVYMKSVAKEIRRTDTKVSNIKCAVETKNKSIEQVNVVNGGVHVKVLESSCQKITNMQRTVHDDGKLHEHNPYISDLVLSEEETVNCDPNDDTENPRANSLQEDDCMSLTLGNDHWFKMSNLDAYEAMSRKYGLVFKDIDYNDYDKIPGSEEQLLKNVDCMNSTTFDKYPIASISSVSWNPNYASHCWLFSAGQSGVARLTCMSGINTLKSKMRKSEK